MSNSDSDSYHDDPVTSENNTKKKSPSILALLLLIVGGTFFIQTTLASNVSLNAGSPIEFGQGVIATTACSGNTPLLITPHARFWNSTGSGSFRFDSITVSGIPAECQGYDFTINAFGDSDNVQLAIFNSNSTNAVIYDNAGIFEAGVGSSGLSASGSSGNFTVIFANPVAFSSSIFKITIQSGEHTIPSCAQGGTCDIGSVGPGGGRVFYIAITPFVCGAILDAFCSNLEAASSTGISAWTPSNYAWSGTTNTRIGTTETTIGRGLVNTNVIIGQSSTASRAATIAQAYRGPNNLNDWFLPSKDELNQMCKWVRGVEWISDATVCSAGTGSSGAGAQGFGVGGYWSSSEAAVVNNAAWIQSFGDGNQYDFAPKGNSYWVRPIRAF